MGAPHMIQAHLTTVPTTGMTLCILKLFSVNSQGCKLFLVEMAQSPGPVIFVLLSIHPFHVLISFQHQARIYFH